MKILLKACSSNDCWSADYLLVDLDVETVKHLREVSAKCHEFLERMDEKYIGYVALSVLHFDCGTGIDGNEQELESRGWTVVPDDAVFAEDDEARIEMRVVKFYHDGTIILYALSKYSSDHVDAELPKEVLELIEKQPA